MSYLYSKLPETGVSPHIGTGGRRNTMETALSFDVDWIRGQSVGIFPVQYSSPGPIIAELEKILDAGDGEEDNAIHLPCPGT
jgi:hypothetical protein